MQELYAQKPIVFSTWSHKFWKHPSVEITVIGKNGDNNPKWTIDSIEQQAYNIDEDDEKQAEMDVWKIECFFAIFT